MSVLKVGDWAEIKELGQVDKKEKHYVVIQINDAGTEIEVENAVTKMTLIYDKRTKSWHIKNTRPIKYVKVEFLQSMLNNMKDKFQFDSLPLEAQIYVLRNLDDETFDQICSLDSMAYLCTEAPNAERVYQERSEKWFAKDILNLKSKKMTWREFYERIIEFIDNKDAYIENINSIADDIRFDYNLEIKLLSTFNPPILPNDYNITQMVTRNYEMLKWFESRGIFPKLGWWAPTDNDIFKKALQYGEIEVIDWFLKKGYKPDVLNGINYIALYRPLEFAEFMKSKGYLPSKEAFRRATESADEERLNWLRQNGITDEFDEKARTIIANNSLFSGGELKIIKWLIEHNYIPTTDGANSAAAYGNIEVLNYLASKGILPDERGKEYARNNRKHEVLLWFANRRSALLIDN